MLIILSITAVLDFAITMAFQRQIHELLTDEAQRASENAYRYDVPFHHDLKAGQDVERRWGTRTYRHVTDRYGLRSGECAGRAVAGQYNLPAETYSYFLVGDSFTEGLGYGFDQVWAGRFACLALAQGRRAFNLGVMSFSPTLYLQKIKRFQSESGIAPDHVVVFLDISDIEDEGRVYRIEDDGRVALDSQPLGFAMVEANLRRNLTSVEVLGRVADGLFGSGTTEMENSLGRERARWTIDEDLFRDYGEKGLETAAKRLTLLAGYCRRLGCKLTLAVYPWPDQIFAGDRNSVQVSYWRAWSADNGVDFLNLFPAFFEDEPEATIGRYFIPGDVHWNVEGNALIFRKLSEHLGLSPRPNS